MAEERRKAKRRKIPVPKSPPRSAGFINVRQANIYTSIYPRALLNFGGMLILQPFHADMAIQLL